jgi:hypothetical protein
MTADRVRSLRLEDDLDRPLHRIFPFWRFEEILRSGRMALVVPALWEDTREDPLASSVMTAAPSSGFDKLDQPLEDYLAACWAQCWSTDAESDVLLRSYSRIGQEKETWRKILPEMEGIRATTTPRRLLGLMTRWAATHLQDHFYLAAVEYEPEGEFGSALLGRLSGPEGPLHFSKPDGRAESLCVKRARFRDEREVRLLCVGDGRLGSGGDVRIFDVDANTLFTEIAFDPRLSSSEQKARADRIASTGFAGNIVDDASYAITVNTIPMKSEWADPPDR